MSEKKPRAKTLPAAERELRVLDFPRAEYVREAKRLSGSNAQATRIGLLYDYVTYVAGTNSATLDASQAIAWWLRAPCMEPSAWYTFQPGEYPNNRIGLLLKASAARLGVQTNHVVHMGWLAALAGCTGRWIRKQIASGLLEPVATDSAHHEWLLPKSAGAWLEERRKRAVTGQDD